MTYLFLVVLVIAIVFFMKRRRSPAISWEALQEALRNGGKLIDVRSDAEYRSGHAEGAKHIPLGNIKGGDYAAMPKDTSIFVYCHSGGRASMAKASLVRAGYTNVTNLGGLASWRRLGGKVVKK